MPTTVVDLHQFARVLGERVQRDQKIAHLAALEAAQRAVTRAVQRTDQLGLVDQGLYKLSWKAEGTVVRNDAPYAAVIEHGRRPGRPGPPLAPIREWVARKLVAEGKVEPAEVEGVAIAIREAIHRRGTPPRKVLGDLIPRMRADYVEAIVRYLER